eukprot:jgi/Tetstr1/432551/TSEL_021922.t1
MADELLVAVLSSLERMARGSGLERMARGRWGSPYWNMTAEMRVGEAEMRHRHGKMWPCDSHQRHPKAPDGLTWFRVSA